MTHCINIASSKVNPTMEITGRKVKTDRIDINGLYMAYNTEDVVTFKETCILAIEQSSGKKETKMRFVNELRAIRSKDRMLMVVNNFWLAGQGLKV